MIAHWLDAQEILGLSPVSSVQVNVLLIDCLGINVLCNNPQLADPFYLLPVLSYHLVNHQCNFVDT